MTSENAVESAISLEEPIAQVEAQTEETPAQTEEVKPEVDAEKEKLAKALSRKQSKIGKLTAEKYHYQQEIDRLQKELTSKSVSEPKKLKAEDFETVDEYFEAVAESKASDKLKEYELKNLKEREETTQKTYQAERVESFNEQAEIVSAKIPDFKTIMDENKDTELLPHVQEALLESDNGPLAAYYALKEGLLEDLNSMSPAKAAVEIGKILIRAETLLQKPVSKTPAPMSPLKGSAAGGRSLESMSPRDLSAWVRS